jgi:general stress protein CsbA
MVALLCFIWSCMFWLLVVLLGIAYSGWIPAAALMVVLLTASGLRL